MPRAAKVVVPPKAALTLAHLSTYDDVATDALVDHVYYWTTVPKNRPSYHASRTLREEDITAIIKKNLIIDPDLDVATDKLLATDGLSRFHGSLKTAREKSDFRQHLRRYMRIYLPDCPVEVSTTNRYTITTHEAAVHARRYIKRNDVIKYLCGIQVTITDEELADLSSRKKDFSIVVSSRCKNNRLFMGPARFANHDCNANARLVTTGTAGMEIVATEDIDVGDEVTVSYGENYFGEDNRDCLCKTCEIHLRNGWRQSEDSSPITVSIEPDQASTTVQGYSLRRRRLEERDDSSSRTPSVAPDIRPRVYKTKSKLLQRQQVSILTPDSDTLQVPLPNRLKRQSDALDLNTPPATPAKRLKSTLSSGGDLTQTGRAKSRSSSMTSMIMSRTTSATGVSVETELTTPESDMQNMAATSTAELAAARLPTPDDQPKQETILRIEAIESIGSGVASIERHRGMSIRDLLNTPSVMATPHIEREVIDPLAAYGARLADEAAGYSNASAAQAIWSSPPPSQRSQSADDAMEVTQVVDAEIVIEHQAPVRRGPGRPRRAETEGEDEDEDEQPKYRTPGDYTLTPVLLSEPNTAWIRCTICDTAFVQRDAYCTRFACPRCERHSKLYGYVWPKTQKEGKNDTEERVLDHRTINRFLDLSNERAARGWVPLAKPPADAVAKGRATAIPGRRTKAKQQVAMPTASAVARRSRWMARATLTDPKPKRKYVKATDKVAAAAAAAAMISKPKRKYVKSVRAPEPEPKPKRKYVKSALLVKPTRKYVRTAPLARTTRKYVRSAPMLESKRKYVRIAPTRHEKQAKVVELAQMVDGVPIKRKRGRPRKRPLTPEPEEVEAEVDADAEAPRRSGRMRKASMKLVEGS